jgi:hypothetical protein
MRKLSATEKAGQDDRRAFRPIHFVIFAVFVLLGFASWQGLVWSRANQHWHLVGLCVAGCAIASFCGPLSLLIPWQRFVERRRLEKLTQQPWPSDPVLPYSASYSVRERVFFAGVTAFFVLDAWLQFHRPGHELGKVLISLLTLGSVAALYSRIFTTVRFTEESIAARVKPFPGWSEPYTAVTSMHAQRGNLRMKFKSGRKLNLALGLGHFATIAAILEKRVNISPTSG